MFCFPLVAAALAQPRWEGEWGLGAQLEPHTCAQESRKEAELGESVPSQPQRWLTGKDKRRCCPGCWGSLKTQLPPARAEHSVAQKAPGYFTQHQHETGWDAPNKAPGLSVSAQANTWTKHIDLFFFLPPFLTVSEAEEVPKCKEKWQADPALTPLPPQVAPTLLRKPEGKRKKEIFRGTTFSAP